MNRRLETVIVALLLFGNIAWLILVNSFVSRSPTRSPVTSMEESSLHLFNKYWVRGKTFSDSSVMKGIFKNYTILSFNNPRWLPIKTFNHFLSNTCGYNNCRVTTDLSNLHNASAIIYCITAAPLLPKTPPINQSDRNPDQVWIFLSGESPIHHGGSGAVYKNEHWGNTSNWTMTYTHHADIYFPYGAVRQRTAPVKNYKAIFQGKTKMAAWAVSHCRANSKRDNYVEKLQQYGVQVDIMGGCAKKWVKGDLMEQKLNSEYKFYLSFENSLCKDYITEKFFKYLSYDVVLVVRGGGNYKSFLPSDSYINTADFDSVEALAEYLHLVGSSEERYVKYLMNKDRYESFGLGIRNGSFCQVCEKLNNLKQNRRTYTAAQLGIGDKGTCFAANDLN